MENNLHIFIDRLKDDKEENILDTLSSDELDIKNEDDDFHQFLKAKVQVQLFKNFFRR